MKSLFEESYGKTKSKDSLKMHIGSKVYIINNINYTF